MARTKAELVRAFKLLEDESRKYGLRVNQDKTKYMVINDYKKGRQASVEVQCENEGRVS